MIALLFLLFWAWSAAAQAQVVGPTLSPAVVVQPMSVPSGGPPQVVGYSQANTPESESIVGDITLQRTGASQYTATVVQVSGITVGRLATLNVGNGLEVGANDDLDLITPVPITEGGVGTTTAPTAGQILIAQSATAYAPMPVGGDVTMGLNGQFTVSRINGFVPGGACATNAFVSSISQNGIPFCSVPTIVGVPNGAPPQFVGYAATNTGESETLGGGTGGCTYTRVAAGAYRLDCPGFAPTNSPTFTGVVTMPTGGWTNTGIATAAGNFSGNLSAGGILSAPNISVSSGTGTYTAAAGAKYEQPGWTGTAPMNAVWDQNGIQNMQAIGIGQAVGADPLDITNNQNTVTAITVTNSNTGPSAQSAVRAFNGTNTMGFGITSTGASTLPNTGFLSSTSGLAYITGNNLPHQFYVGSNVMATIGSNGLQLPTPLGTGNGGVGTGAAPAQNQVLIAQSATAYAPQTISGDLTLASTGVATAGTSGTYQPVLYAGTTTGCGITYNNSAGNGQVGYYYKIGKQVTVYFMMTLSSLGTCGNLPLYVSVPFPPSTAVNAFIAGYDFVQITSLLGLQAGAIPIAQSGGLTLGSGAVLLGTMLNGNGATLMTANISANSTMRGRVIYLTD